MRRSESMLALELTPAGLAVRSDLPLPIPQAGEVRIRVLRAGICETDLQLEQGYMGFQGVLGHEFVGIAESGRFAGQRVVGEINCACHQCPLCQQGLTNHCPHRTVLGILGRPGAFAEYVYLPEINLHRVPDNVPTDAAVFTEPLAAAFQIVQQVDVASFRQVVVLGDGRLGQLCARVLHRHVSQLVVVGRHASKLQLLQQAGIETRLLNGTVPAAWADFVVDCTGSAAGLADACRMLKPRGTLVLKTTVAGQPALNLAPLVIDELTVIGSRCGPFIPALAALERQEIDVQPLISARFPLTAAIDAFELVKRSKTAAGSDRATPVLKVLLEISPDSAA
jgi:threonine dehydrogenase-like Zn-dependent dehydrogenase